MTTDVLGGAPEVDWVGRHLGALAGWTAAAYLPAVTGVRCSPPGGSSLRRWPRPGRWCWCLRICIGPMMGCWISSITWPTGRRGAVAGGLHGPARAAGPPAGWGGGKPNALTLSLAPLSEQDTARLIGSCWAFRCWRQGSSRCCWPRPVAIPLYAEQYAQMLAEQGSGQQPPLPESIQGIIAARLDLLALPQKRLLQDAAVVGKVFWPGAVAALGGGADRGELEGYLHGLERKQFIRRQRRSSVAGETQYTFVHVLVLDVAYGQIPRAARADQHAAAAVGSVAGPGGGSRRDACAPLSERAGPRPRRRPGHRRSDPPARTALQPPVTVSSR